MQKILGIITIAGLSAACSAQSSPQAWRGGEKSTVSMQSSDGKDSYEVRIQDGKITAKMNGEDVPPERVVRTKSGDRDVIEIRDENGNVVKTFDMLGSGLSGGNLYIAPHVRNGSTLIATAVPKAARAGGFRATDSVHEHSGEDVAAVETMDNPPPVMVGVTMTEPDDSVLEFLKLEKGVVFDRIIDDLPAAKAGILVGDILVEVKGEKNINQERFREILRGTKPGDTLAVKVARAGGEVHAVTLSLVAFDAKALGRTEAKADNADNGWDAMSHQDSHKNWENAHKALEEAMKQLRDNPNLQPEAMKKTLKESLEKAMESVKQAKDSLRDVQIFSNNGQWNTPQGATKFRLAPGQNRLMVVPSDPTTAITPAMPEVDDGRIQKLEKKMEELNKKLDKIAKMLEDRK